MNSYSIREVRLESGERLPVLVHNDPLGLPVLEALRFNLTRLRSRGLRRASIRQSLAALRITLHFLDSKKIDLVARAADYSFLSLDELVTLADLCRARRKPKPGRTVITAEQAAVRFSTALDYVLWISEPVIARMTDPRRRESANFSLERFRKRARSVAPKPRGRVRTSTASAMAWRMTSAHCF